MTADGGDLLFFLYYVYWRVEKLLRLKNHKEEDHDQGQGVSDKGNVFNLFLRLQVWC